MDFKARVSPGKLVFALAFLVLTSPDCPAASRFKDNGDGTVTDTRTGLMWMKDANPAKKPMPWRQKKAPPGAVKRPLPKGLNALTYIEKLNSGKGTLGYKDWRMPEIEEFITLIDASRPGGPKIELKETSSKRIEKASEALLSSPPALPAGHPFKNAVSFWYWSNTTPVEICVNSAWVVNLATGQKWTDSDKDENLFYVWPVRGKKK